MKSSKTNKIETVETTQSNVKLDIEAFYDSLNVTIKGKVGHEFSDNYILEDVMDSIDCINRINNHKTSYGAVLDYTYPLESVKILNTLFSDPEYMIKFLQMCKLLYLGKVAHQVLNTKVTLYKRKGDSVGSEYLVARTNIQSFKYVNGVRKATTKRYSAHVGLLSKYPKKLNDPKAKKDALPKLYNKILKRTIFEKE